MALLRLSATFKDAQTGEDVKIGGLVLMSIHKQLRGRGITAPVDVLDQEGNLVGWATSDACGRAANDPDAHADPAK